MLSTIIGVLLFMHVFFLFNSSISIILISKGSRFNKYIISIQVLLMLTEFIVGIEYIFYEHKLTFLAIFISVILFSLYSYSSKMALSYFLSFIKNNNIEANEIFSYKFLSINSIHISDIRKFIKDRVLNEKHTIKKLNKTYREIIYSIQVNDNEELRIYYRKSVISLNKEKWKIFNIEFYGNNKHRLFQINEENSYKDIGMFK